jgi:hypothetical protein
VNFYDADGTLVKEFLLEPLVLAPWHSATYLAAKSTLAPIQPYDRNLGRQFFIVEWESDERVVAPKIIGNVSSYRTTGYPIAQGISVVGGIQVYNHEVLDGVVLEQTWGWERHRR